MNRTRIPGIALRLVPLILALGGIMFIRPVPVAAGTAYYVGPSGDDSNPGTQDQPWKTIQHAIDSAGTGDTIYIRAGVYAESIQLHRSGQEGSPITLANYGGETVTIDGGGDPAIADLDGTEYWIVQGLTLESDAEHTLLLEAWGCDGTCRGTHHWTIRNNKIVGAVKIYGSYNLFETNEVDGSQHKGSENAVQDLYDASHHNTFRSNHIHDFNIRGIWSMHRTHDDIIESNYIHDIGSATEGMCIDTDGFGTVEWRHVIRGNHLHNCGEAGVELENTFDSLVENNTIHDTGMTGIRIINYGPNIGPGTDKCQAGGENNQYGDTDGDNDCEGDLTGNTVRQNLIYNGAQQGAIAIHHAGGIDLWGNTISHTSGRGIVLDSGKAFCPEISVRNNIIADSGQASISLEEVASLSQDDHNLLYNTGSEGVYELWSNGTQYTLSQYQAATDKGQGSIQADPRFVDPAGGNFHIQDISPAIDAGVNIGLAEDLDETPRPQGGGYDIGAYESSAVGITATPVPSPTLLPPSPAQQPSPTALPPSRTTEPSPTTLLLPPTLEPLSTPTFLSLTPGVPLMTLTPAPARIDVHQDSAVEGGDEVSSILSVVRDLVVRVFEWLVNEAAIAISNARRILAR